MLQTTSVIVLAAGSGKRLSSVTSGIPKQFWPRPDRGTLLEDTLVRMRPIAAADRTVVIVGDEHKAYVQAHAAALDGMQVVYQPRDRGTAAGVALALLPILDESPDDVVVITPSDHGVANTDMFVDGIAAAVNHVETRGGVVICGVEPTHPTEDYGWILPAGDLSVSRLAAVSTFVEKPESRVAAALFRVGGVWNTMVTVARARTLFELYRHHLAELTSVFIQALRMRRVDRHGWLTAAYETLVPADFCRDLLSSASGLTTLVWPAALGWSDLGTPERLARWTAGGQADTAAPRSKLDLLSPSRRAALARRSNPRGSVPNRSLDVA